MDYAFKMLWIILLVGLAQFPQAQLWTLFVVHFGFVCTTIYVKPFKDPQNFTVHLAGDILVLVVYVLLQVSQSLYDKVADAETIQETDVQLFTYVNNYGIVLAIWIIVGMHFFVLFYNKLRDYMLYKHSIINNVDENSLNLGLQTQNSIYSRRQDLASVNLNNQKLFSTDLNQTRPDIVNSNKQ